jgi:hypothetical protein
MQDARMFCSAQVPPDAIYYDAAFEIKGIVNERRCRHDEIKQDRQKKSQKTQPQYLTLKPVIDFLLIDARRLILQGVPQRKI